MQLIEYEVDRNWSSSKLMQNILKSFKILLDIPVTMVIYQLKPESNTKQ